MLRSIESGYSRPSSLSEATQQLSQSRWNILAGGTDVYPGWSQQSAWGRKDTQPILDITGIKELRQVETLPDGFRIGALAKWRDMLDAELPGYFEALKQAAREVGGPQIQNQATIAGNICNASPAADGVPPLLVLGAQVELASHTGRRNLPLETFLEGNRRTARRQDELVTGLFLPRHSPNTCSRFLKLGSRRNLVISIVSVAALFEVTSSNRIARARIAVGSCSEVPQRLPELELRLEGKPFEKNLAGLLEESDTNQLTPIDDIRADRTYRKHAALVLTRRVIEQLCEEHARS